jgi:hypothetical protein
MALRVPVPYSKKRHIEGIGAASTPLVYIFLARQEWMIFERTEKASSHVAIEGTSLVQKLPSFVVKESVHSHSVGGNLSRTRGVCGCRSTKRGLSRILLLRWRSGCVWSKALTRTFDTMTLAVQMLGDADEDYLAPAFDSPDSSARYARLYWTLTPSLDLVRVVLASIRIVQYNTGRPVQIPQT